MVAAPRAYDREFTTSVSHRARRRVGFTTERGDVQRFVVQLEYCLEGEWTPVVRYDHDHEGEHAHDVTEEGLHIDIYRDGETHATEYIAPALPAGIALDFAEDHLSENLQRFIERFEKWHGIRTSGL